MEIVAIRDREGQWREWLKVIDKDIVTSYFFRATGLLGGALGPSMPKATRSQNVLKMIGIPGD